MKILAIGDFHGKFPVKLRKEVNKADLVLCTGDFGGSDKLLKVIFKYFYDKWWEKVGSKKAKEYVLKDYNSGKEILKQLDSFKKPIYIISGNWDFITKSKLEKTAGLKLKLYPKIIRNSKSLNYWRRGLKHIEGLEILAFGGMVTAGDYLKKDAPLPKRRKERAKRWNKKETDQIMRYGKKDIDILFAHYPPYGFFDMVKYKGENPMNGKHVGFKGYTNFIKKYKPKLVICGHMHEYQGKKKIGRTIIVATGSAKEGKAAIIDYDEKKRKVRKIRFIK